MLSRGCKALRRRCRSWLVALALCIGALLLPAGPFSSGLAAAGEPEEDKSELAAQLHLKILSYDRNLKARSGGKLVIAIVYRTDREESARMRGLMQDAFRGWIGKSTVQGLSFSVTAVAFDGKTLNKRLADVGATAIYVTPGLEDGVGAISAAAQALKAPTLCGRRGLVDAGLAIAVVNKDDRPAIVINLPVAKALGMDLDLALLRLAEVKK